MIICANMALGILISGLGISSARWDTQSGVPIAYAPLSMPIKNTKPLDEYPISADHSLKTNAGDACGDLPPVPGIAAQTTMVIHTPPRMKNKPTLLSAGRARLAKSTMQQQHHVTMR